MAQIPGPSVSIIEMQQVKQSQDSSMVRANLTDMQQAVSVGAQN